MLWNMRESEGFVEGLNLRLPNDSAYMVTFQKPKYLAA